MGRELELFAEPSTIVPVDFKYEDGERTTVRRSPTTYESRQIDGRGFGWSEYVTFLDRL